MTVDEILAVLSGEAGYSIPGRGVGADDVLLGRYAKLDAGTRSVFWPAFGQAIRQIWAEAGTEAWEAACSFVARLADNELPSPELATACAGFLADDPTVNAIAADVGDGRRVVAALQVLATLRLGKRTWWQCRFREWKLAAASSDGGEMLAWQAMLHASRGLMRCEQCQFTPNINAWFEVARHASDIPAMEIFAVLSEQGDRDSDKTQWAEEVVSALLSFCPPHGDLPKNMVDIRSVVETWLVDRMGAAQENAQRRLTPKEPDKRPPWVKIDQPLVQQHISP